MGNNLEIELSSAPARAALDGGGLLLYAPAKINLNLLVGPCADDGFHSVDSIVAKVTMYDTLEIRRRSDDRIVLDCIGADCGPPERNLVMQAAGMLADRRDVCGVDIKLTKVIPPGSGLGGGSSDAAAALRGLNELWGLGPDTVSISETAAKLGSDVPLFLGPPAARLTGRGERVEPVELGAFTAVVVASGLMCSTVEVYRAYDRLGVRDSAQINIGSPASDLPSSWRGRLVNDLTDAAMDICPELSELRARVQAVVDVPVHMSGSGSALFMLYDDVPEARRALGGLDDDLQGMSVIVGVNPW